MATLNSEQKQLIFDYCIGLASEEQNAEAKQLIQSNKKAADIYARLKAALSPLDSLEAEACPDELVEGTIWRLNNAARSSQLQLQQLLAAEQKRQATSKNRFWWDLSKRLTIAAVFVIVGSTLVTVWNITSRYARQKSWQQQCQAQLGRIFRGINQYSSDHDGKMPAVATTAGEPWWKVGYQGKENQSNTRHIWLLVKGDYVNPVDFICPGRKRDRKILFNPAQIRNFNDFPNRNYISYSFQIRPIEFQRGCKPSENVLIADSNPLFEILPSNFSEQFKVRLNRKLSTINSVNHNRRGQNALSADGRVMFVKTRNVGVANDDIFTLQGTDVYHGIEVPACETDAFLAP